MWNEKTHFEHIMCSPDQEDFYSGPEGGTDAGPSPSIQHVGWSAENVAAICLFILPLNVFQVIAKLTHRYCYKDWVIEKNDNDRDGNEKKYLSG